MVPLHLWMTTSQYAFALPAISQYSVLNPTCVERVDFWSYVLERVDFWSYVLGRVDFWLHVLGRVFCCVSEFLETEYFNSDVEAQSPHGFYQGHVFTILVRAPFVEVVQNLSRSSACVALRLPVVTDVI